MERSWLEITGGSRRFEAKESGRVVADAKAVEIEPEAAVGSSTTRSLHFAKPSAAKKRIHGVTDQRHKTSIDAFGGRRCRRTFPACRRVHVDVVRHDHASDLASFFSSPATSDGDRVRAASDTPGLTSPPPPSPVVLPGRTSLSQRPAWILSLASFLRPPPHPTFSLSWPATSEPIRKPKIIAVLAPVAVPFLSPATTMAAVTSNGFVAKMNPPGSILEIEPNPLSSKQRCSNETVFHGLCNRVRVWMCMCVGVRECVCWCVTFLFLFIGTRVNNIMKRRKQLGV